MRDIDKMLIKFSKVGSVPVVKYLLSQGADAHTRNDMPLLTSVFYGNIEAVKTLLEHGAGVKVSRYEALIEAIDRGHIEIAKLLKEHMKQSEERECARQ